MAEVKKRLASREIGDLVAVTSWITVGVGLLAFMFSYASDGNIFPVVAMIFGIALAHAWFVLLLILRPRDSPIIPMAVILSAVALPIASPFLLLWTVSWTPEQGFMRAHTVLEQGGSTRYLNGNSLWKVHPFIPSVFWGKTTAYPRQWAEFLPCVGTTSEGLEIRSTVQGPLLLPFENLPQAHAIAPDPEGLESIINNEMCVSFAQAVGSLALGEVPTNLSRVLNGPFATAWMEKIGVRPEGPLRVSDFTVHIAVE